MNSLDQVVAEKTCVDWSTLVELNAGRLTEERLESLAAHLADCVKCQTMLSEWRDDQAGYDDFSRRLKHCLLPHGVPDEPGLLALERAGIGVRDRETVTHAPGSAPPRIDAWVGKSVGDFELLEMVGHGGMGVVYRAWQKLLNRVVAVKMLRPGIVTTNETIKRFHTEAVAIARLKHPNIVELIHISEHDGLPFFAMEWVEGGTLETKLAVGPLPLREAAELIRVLAEALEFTHRSHVLHRDLKPSNVLIALDGVPKIADFGVAKLQDETANLTHTEGFLGTPSYMAPEQAAGRPKEIDRCTDVYALGAILYETLTGQPPFRGDDKLDTMRRIREEALIPPSHRRKGLPADLEAICVKCLEKSPRRRYGSAQSLADDLGLWLNNQKPREIPGPITRMARRIGRHPVLVGCTLLLVTASLVVATGGPWLHPNRRADDPTTKEIAAKDVASNEVEDFSRRERPLGTTIKLFRDDFQPVMYKRPFGIGEFAAAPNELILHSRSKDVQRPALLALDDPEAQNFEFSVELRAFDQGKLGANDLGIFFGWRVPEAGALERWRFFAVQLDQRPIRADLHGRLNIGTWYYQDTVGAKQGLHETNIRVLPARGIVALPPPPESGFYRVWVRVVDGTISVSLGELKPVEFDLPWIRSMDKGIKGFSLSPQGAVGIWTRNGRGSFRNATVTALPKG